MLGGDAGVELWLFFLFTNAREAFSSLYYLSEAYGYIIYYLGCDHHLAGFHIPDLHFHRSGTLGTGSRYLAFHWSFRD